MGRGGEVIFNKPIKKAYLVIEYDDSNLVISGWPTDMQIRTDTDYFRQSMMELQLTMRVSEMTGDALKELEA